MAEVPMMGPERGLTTYNNSYAAKSSLAQQKEEETRPKLQATIQGQVIAKSGLSNLNKDLKSHLLFELLEKNKFLQII